MKKTKEKSMTKKELNMKMMDTERKNKTLTTMSSTDKSSWTNNKCK
jgi:hypothetical protein